MKKVIVFIVCLLFGLTFINAGLNKFFFYMPAPKDLPEKMVKMGEAMASIGWLMPLVGLAEIVGGFLFIIPRTRALGAIIVLPVLVGVVLTGISVPSSGLAIPLILALIEVVVIYSNRERYLPMVAPR